MTTGLVLSAKKRSPRNTRPRRARALHDEGLELMTTGLRGDRLEHEQLPECLPLIARQGASNEPMRSKRIGAYDSNRSPASYGVHSSPSVSRAPAIGPLKNDIAHLGCISAVLSFACTSLITNHRGARHFVISSRSASLVPPCASLLASRSMTRARSASVCSRPTHQSPALPSAR